jgi:hypothetical protein
MSMLLDKPPVRTGRCGLTLSIDGRRYRLRPADPTGPRAKIWRLTVLAGQSRAGTTYSVCQISRSVDCTCPDACANNAVCKHIRALQALGLVSPRAKASIMIDWQNTLSDVFNPPEKPASAETRRKHKAPLPDPADPEIVAAQRETAAPRARPLAEILPPPDPESFATGFRAAVADEIARAGGAR